MKKTVMYEVQRAVPTIQKYRVILKVVQVYPPVVIFLEKKGLKVFSKKPYTNVDIFREKVFLKKFGSR
jgi:hypothetical protein